MYDFFPLAARIDYNIAGQQYKQRELELNAVYKELASMFLGYCFHVKTVYKTMVMMNMKDMMNTAMTKTCINRHFVWLK